MGRYTFGSASRGFSRRVRTWGVGISVVALTAVVAAPVGTAGAAGPSVKANGAITCAGLTGTIKFSPALQNGGHAAESITAKLALSDCAQAGNTNVPSSAITAESTLTVSGVTNSCSSVTSLGSTSLSAPWKGSAPASTIDASTLTASGSSAASDSSGHVGFTLTNPTTAGSYSGASAGTVFGNLTAAAIASACASTHGLKSLTVSGGSLQFGPLPAAPVFTSPTAATFNEAGASSFTVSATDPTDVRFAWSGNLPPGLRLVNNQDNRTATISGTPAAGTKGLYTLALTAVDANGRHTAQTLSLTVSPPTTTAPIVTGISPTSGSGGAFTTISGIQFTGAAQVLFGTVAASFTVTNDTTITAMIPAGGTGTVDVTVVAPGGTSPTVTGGMFTFQGPPARPFIVDVRPQGLSLYATWSPNSTIDQVTGYTAITQVAAGYVGLVPPGCGTIADTPAAGTDTAALVAGVCAGVPYTVAITATNGSGTSAPSGLSLPTVPLNAQAPSPPLLTGTFARSSSVIVQWSPPPQTGGDPLIHYTLSASTKSTKVTVSPPSDATEATIPGLTNGTKYTISLVANSDAGPSDAVTRIVKPSATIKPTAPAGLLVVPDGHGKVVATWSPPTDEGSKAPTSYTLTAKATDQSGSAASAAAAINVTVPATATTYSFTTLSPTAAYDISVIATTPVGKSKAIATSSPVSPQVAIAPNTTILSQASADALVFEHDGTLTFPAAPPAQVAALAPGDIVVAPPSANARDGYLATVQTVSTDGAGHHIVDTTPAAYGDAFDDLSFSVTGVPPTGSPLVVQGEVPGLSTHTSPVNHDPTYGLNWSSGQSSASGSVGFTPNVSMSAGFTCTHKILGICNAGNAHAEANTSLTANAGITAVIVGSTSIPIATIQFGCICFSVGPVPVAIYPQLGLRLDLSGSIHVNANASVTIGGSINWSSNGGFSAGPSGPGVTVSPSAPTLVANGSGTATLVVTPSACLYAVLCGNFEARGILTATAQLSPPPYFKLCATLTLSVGFTFHLLWWNTSNTAQIYNHAFLPCLTIGPVPPITITVSPQNPTVAIGVAVQQFTSGTNGPPSPVTWSLIGAQFNDSISPSGMLSTGAPGNRTFTVKATNGNGLTATSTVHVGSAFAYDPPKNLAFAPMGGTGTLSWQAPVNTGGHPIIGYTVVVFGHHNIGFFNQMPIYVQYAVNTAGTSLQVPVWPMHTWYTFTVYARNTFLVASPAATGSYFA